MNFGQYARIILILSLFAGLSACQQMRENGQTERIRVIIEFALPAESGASGKAEKKARDDARKKAEEVVLRIVGEESRLSVRRFRMLPIISLEIDAKTLAKLLRVPEVESVQLDRNMEFFETPGVRSKK